METNAKWVITKLVITMVVACILITPALSQGFGREGGNGMQGNNMGQAQDQGMNSGLGFAPDGLDNGNKQGQPPAEPKFKGCNTWQQNMNAMKLMNKPSANSEPAPDKEKNPNNGKDPENGQAPDNGHTPWVYAGQDNGNGNPGDHHADADQRNGMRSICPDSPPRQEPRKSIMGDWHKKDPKPLIENHFQKMPPMKSIMDDRHKPMPRPLMDIYFPEMPPRKSIMDHVV